MTKALRVIIADDQVNHAARIKAAWRSALGSGPEIDFYHSIQDLREKLQTRPHVIICDNQFSESINEGVTFIASAKLDHPDTVFVLMTGKSFDIEQLGQRVPNPDLLVPKPYLLNDKYLAFLGGELRSRVPRTPCNIHVPKEVESIGITKQAFVSLVEQCVTSFNVLEFEVEAEYTVKFSLLSGGYSGAAVYQMNLEGAGRAPNLPLVMKCGTREQISREVGAFERWVRWQLPHDMRVDIIGRGNTRDHAGVCYGFVLGSSTELQTFTDVIRAVDFSISTSLLRRLFFAERSGWYLLSDADERPLSNYIANKPEYATEKDERRNNKLRQACAEVSETENMTCEFPSGLFIVNGKSYGPVRGALFDRASQKVKLCYCHGDLNSNNIFLDKSGTNVALIDFEQSGEDHIFRDFISIETSIRMNLPEEQTQTLSFFELVEYERKMLINPGEECGDDFGEWVSLPRKLAREKFPNAEDEDYWIPLLLHSWKVLAVSEWDYEVKRRLVAIIFACCSTPQE